MAQEEIRKRSDEVTNPEPEDDAEGHVRGRHRLEEEDDTEGQGMPYRPEPDVS